MSKIKIIINKINQDCEALEFSEARRMIELNLQELQNPRNYVLLNTNAAVLFKYVLNQENEATAPLTRLELFQLNEINKYCTEFNISMLKRTIRNSLGLLQRPEIEHYLNNNAKTVLASMGAFIKNEIKQG